ncbi:hypothetical protein [Pseudonocardia sp. TRM90224]|uniref:hypothetical protein n=1 Tax=Pseudonocardia sp. TRM90224 TaxID=2812678 RepID=UPI001E65A10C|nr:hypothetical protein [Pseudonocardia sp. TRM90224]
MDEQVVAETERWLRRSGTPLLSRGFAGHRVLYRSAPALAGLFVYLVAGAVADGIWRRLPGLWELPFDDAMERATEDDAGYFYAGLAAPVVLGLATALVVGRVARRKPADWSGPFPMAIAAGTLVITPILTAVASVSMSEAFEQLLRAAVFLVGVLLAVRSGLAAVVLWTARQAVVNFADVLRLTSRALPLLLLFVTFLFINTENWQVASALNRPQLWGVAAFFVVCMLLFLSATLPKELAALPPVHEVSPTEACAGTPLAAVVGEVARAGVTEHPLRPVERLNLLLTMALQQVMQSALLGLVVWVFFVLFGRLAITDGVIESWTGRPPEPGMLFPESLQIPLPVSTQLIHVAVVLGAFSALYFAVYTVTDANYRSEFLTEMLVDVNRGRMVRDCYLTYAERLPKP